MDLKEIKVIIESVENLLPDPLINRWALNEKSRHFGEWYVIEDGWS